MNRLTSEQRAKVISCLIEGNSVRSSVRITGVAKKTVMRLVFEVGTFCAEYQNRVFQNLLCERMQVDECWSFCYAKQKNVTPDIAAKNPDRKSTRLNSSHRCISYAVFCLKKKKELLIR